MADQIPPPAPIDDEIDLLALAKTLWLGRRVVIKSILICGVIGLIVAITSPKEFVATTIMVPSSSDASSKLGGLGGLGGLAAMAGINLNTTSGSDLSPIVYPQIVTSVPFQLELMKTPLNFTGLKEQITLFDYYTEIKKPNPLIKYTLGLPGIILKAIKGSNDDLNISSDNKGPITLTDKQRDVRLILSELISLTVNQKEGILTLSSTMPEAKAAAQLGQHAQELLQQYITEFKIKKATANLDFIRQRYDETALKFDTAQEKLASFRDRNKNVSLATAKTEEERLTSQYNLIYSVYTELAKQLEQAKIQVKQDTPVFTIIEPVSVPTKKSKPNRPLIMVIWLFLGGVIGTGVVFGKGFIEPLKKKWGEEV
jgi:uncharacterized protein involved in exopolysaccharide biosynthesis